MSALLAVTTCLPDRQRQRYWW